MPNINLVQTISTSTDNKSYFVMSDNGLVRRFKVEDFVTELQQTILDVARTDQNLFTTTDVTFRSVTLVDTAGRINGGESKHGFALNAYHGTGTNIQTNDLLGTIRFGGFDGRNNTILDNDISPAGISGVAFENWNYSGSTTTNAGTGMLFYHQPVNTRLSTSSRVTFLLASSTSTSTSSQSTSLLRLGTVTIAPFSTSTSANGTTEFSTPARTDINILASRVYQVGIPVEDTSTVNTTWLGTNVYSFVSGRYHTYPGYRQHIQQGDTLGTIEFRGVTTGNQNALTGSISAHATSNYNTARGSGMRFVTMSSATSQLVTSINLQQEGSTYLSDSHTFSDSINENPLTIREGFIYFSDGSGQHTAYPGFTSVPAHSTSTGVIGQMAHDSDYIYICIEQNRWKRILALDF